MRPLSLRVVVESVGLILVLPVARTVIVIGTGTETVMGGGLGRRGIDDHRYRGENRHRRCLRLREYCGVTGIVRRGTDGHCLVPGLGLVRVHQQGGSGGESGTGRLCLWKWYFNKLVFDFCGITGP
jgi:hypothetical protein